VDAVVERTKAVRAGTDAGTMGPVIDAAAQKRVEWYIDNAVEKQGATVLLDGRDAGWSDGTPPTGHWIGPTILLHKSASDSAMQEEIFGPVLSIFCVRTAVEAVKIENASPFGNAACIYTTSGANAEWFTGRFRSAMLGVNVGIPVPREPFSFGGLYGTKSKFGDGDITGDGAMEFFSRRIKVTTRWPEPEGPEFGEPMMESGEGVTDHANFNGRM